MDLVLHTVNCAMLQLVVALGVCISLFQFSVDGRERFRTARQEDHSGTSGMSDNLLCERLSSLRQGSSNKQRRIWVSSLCCRSSLTTCEGGEDEGYWGSVGLLYETTTVHVYCRISFVHSIWLSTQLKEMWECEAIMRQTYCRISFVHSIWLSTQLKEMWECEAIMRQTYPSSLSPSPAAQQTDPDPTLLVGAT